MVRSTGHTTSACSSSIIHPLFVHISNYQKSFCTYSICRSISHPLCVVAIAIFNLISILIFLIDINYHIYILGVLVARRRGGRLRQFLKTQRLKNQFFTIISLQILNSNIHVISKISLLYGCRAWLVQLGRRQQSFCANTVMVCLTKRPKININNVFLRTNNCKHNNISHNST